MAPKKSPWATQVDDEEASGDKSLAPLPAAFAKEPEAAFPSLGDAAKVVETKAERKKKQAKMSLADFNSLRSGGAAAAASSGKFSVASVRARTQQKAADDILLNLPRGPRMDRPEGEEGGSKLGGGFNDYGGNRAVVAATNPAEAAAESWASCGAGGFGDREDRDDRRDRRRGGFGDRDRDDDSQAGSEDGPSRADMADDWGASRKFTPSGADDRDRRGGGFDDRDREPRRGGFGDRDRDGEDDGPSRADAADDWGAKRAPLPDSPRRGSGGGFGDRDRRSGGFADRDGFSSRRESDLFSNSNRADEVDTWGRSSAALRDDGPPRDRTASRDTWGPPRRSDAGPPSAGGGGGERKRLQLAPRTLPKPEIKPAVDPEQVQPAEEADAAKEELKPEALPQARAPRANPFGAARPRELVLAEKSPPSSDKAESANGREETATPAADSPAAKDGSEAEAAPEAKDAPAPEPAKEATLAFSYAAAARKRAEEEQAASSADDSAGNSSAPAKQDEAVKAAAEKLSELST